MDLWLVQYLCPSRHAIIASPYDREQTDAPAQEAAVIAEMTRLGVDFRCGICFSRALHFEHGKLPYTDWDTAWRALKANELANIASRLAIEQTRQDRN